MFIGRKRTWVAIATQLYERIQPMLENDHESVSGFDWDRRKSESNLAKHGIDFEEAVEVFYGPVLLYRSDRNNEERWVAIGSSEDRLIAVVFTRRACYPDNPRAT